MATINNQYQPTAAEEKLLQILANPDYIGKSITAKCRAAGVVKNVYYDGLKKPEFVQLLNNLMLELVKGKVADVVNATYKFAVTCPQNHQDRKVLLEMGGLYTPKQQQEITGANGGPVAVKFEGELDEWSR